MKNFLSSLKSGQLKGIKAACFDTRIKTRFSGDAARKIAKALKKAGADIITDPKAFIVKDKKGPLAEGEEERAGGLGYSYCRKVYTLGFKTDNYPCCQNYENSSSGDHKSKLSLV